MRFPAVEREGLTRALWFGPIVARIPEK